jgi:hypothetical protein
MKLKDVDRDLCPAEQEIIAGLIDIQSGKMEHYRPADMPYLMAALADHHRACATCQGVKLTEQLFGGAVVVL